MKIAQYITIAVLLYISVSFEYGLFEYLTCGEEQKCWCPPQDRALTSGKFNMRESASDNLVEPHTSIPEGSSNTLSRISKEELVRKLEGVSKVLSEIKEEMEQDEKVNFEKEYHYEDEEEDPYSNIDKVFIGDDATEDQPEELVEENYEQTPSIFSRMFKYIPNRIGLWRHGSRGTRDEYEDACTQVGEECDESSDYYKEDDENTEVFEGRSTYPHNLDSDFPNEIDQNVPLNENEYNSSIEYEENEKVNPEDQYDIMNKVETYDADFSNVDQSVTNPVPGIKSQSSSSYFGWPSKYFSWARSKFIPGNRIPQGTPFQDTEDELNDESVVDNAKVCCGCCHRCS